MLHSMLGKLEQSSWLNRRARSRTSGTKRIHRFRGGGIDLENLMEMGGFENPADAFIQSGELQVSASGAYRGQQSYQRTQAAAIHVLNQREIENKGWAQRPRVVLSQLFFHEGTQRIRLFT